MDNFDKVRKEEKDLPMFNEEEYIYTEAQIQNNIKEEADNFPHLKNGLKTIFKPYRHGRNCIR